MAKTKLVARANAVRSRIASVVWLVAVLCALVLAVGALIVALKMNQDNSIIGFVIDASSRLPVRFRAGWVTDTDIDDLAARGAPRPPAPQYRPGDGDVLPFPRTNPTPRTGKEDAS